MSMRMGIACAGTLVGRACRSGSRVVLEGKVLDFAGIEEGEELEVHTDGSMLILLPARLARSRVHESE